MRRTRLLFATFLVVLSLGNLQLLVRSAESSSTGETIKLPISQITQYQASFNKGLLRPWCDCGPASIAMILRYYGFRPALRNKDADLVELSREKTGNTGDCPDSKHSVSGFPPADTDAGELETSITEITKSALTTSEITNNSQDPIKDMFDAVKAGKPVIVFVDGEYLGRKGYGGHWFVLNGFENYYDTNTDGWTAKIVEPDYERASVPNWPSYSYGKYLSISSSVFRDAVTKANYSVRGIIVGDGKTTRILSPSSIKPSAVDVANGNTKMKISFVTSVLTVTNDTVKVWINGQLATVETVSPSDTFEAEVRVPGQLATGLYDLKIQVGPDPTNSDIVTQAVRYSGSSNVDVSLVIDRSGSMVDESKMRSAAIAAGQFVGQMYIGDRVGVVSFDDIVEQTFPLTVITPPSPTSDIRADAQNRINALYPRGGTSIGGGLQGGQSQLLNGDPAHPHSIVLLTDGQENTAPYVRDVIQSIKAQGLTVHTIGLGSGADQSLLLNIASQTGGTYNFAPTGEQLAEIYNTIAT